MPPLPVGFCVSTCPISMPFRWFGRKADVYVTHARSEAFTLADRIVIMSKGRNHIGIEMYNDDLMQRAIALSASALTTPGTEPFGALVIKDGQIVGEGINHSKAHFDPTSHSEIEAIRDACRRLQCVDLSGCELYSSCEPCAMCAATMAVAGIATLYYAANQAQAGGALANLPMEKRHPIDVEAVRIEAGSTIENRRIPASQYRSADAVAILKAWAGQ